MILVLYFYCIVLYLGLLRYRVDFQFSDLNEGIDEVDLNEYWLCSVASCDFLCMEFYFFLVASLFFFFKVFYIRISFQSFLFHMSISFFICRSFLLLSYKCSLLSNTVEYIYIHWSAKVLFSVHLCFRISIPFISETILKSIMSPFSLQNPI